MKKSILGVVLFIMCFFVSGRAFASGVSMGVTGGGNSQVGGSVNTTVTLGSGGNTVCAAEFTLTYPADLLEVTSGPSLGSVFTIATESSNSAGSIHYMIGSGGCSNADATLMSVTFRPKAVGTATLTVGSVSALDGNGAQLGASGGSTTVNIAAASTTTTTPSTTTKKKTTAKPATTTTPAATPAPAVPVLKSIQFQDGKVDSSLPNVSIMNEKWAVVFTGTAVPSTTVNILIKSDPISASTQVDASGNWTYTLDQQLESGAHTITFAAVKDGVKSEDVVADFVADDTRVAIGKTFPEVVSEPTSSTTKQSLTTKATTKTTESNMVLYIGGVVALIVVIAIIIIFIRKRRLAALAQAVPKNNMPSFDSGNPDQAPIINSSASEGQPVSNEMLSPTQPGPQVEQGQNTQNPQNPPVPSQTAPNNQAEQASPTETPASNLTQENTVPVNEAPTAPAQNSDQANNQSSNQNIANS